MWIIVFLIRLLINIVLVGHATSIVTPTSVTSNNKLVRVKRFKLNDIPKKSASTATE